MTEFVYDPPTAELVMHYRVAEATEEDARAAPVLAIRTIGLGEWSKLAKVLTGAPQALNANIFAAAFKFTVSLKAFQRLPTKDAL